MTGLFEIPAVRSKYVFLCLIIIGIVNVYLIHLLIYERGTGLNSEDLLPPNKITPRISSTPKSLPLQSLDLTRTISERILLASKNVRSFFRRPIFSISYSHNFSSLLLKEPYRLDGDVWKIAESWVDNDHIVPADAPLLPHLLEALRTKKIVSADVSTKGTQLKLSLTLEGGQKALFKPKWYERDQVLLGEVYGGKDRHNGEIAAFHLARLLGLHRVPIVAGRKIDLREEILTVASTTLARTFFKTNNNTCFYGVCTYCRPDDGVCGEKHILEGAVVLWLPERVRLVKQRHPWQRSYTAALAKWQVYGNYCMMVRQSKLYQTESQLLDLVETSVFDFLIDNGDRHHYERFAGSDHVLLLDNGKSFGNPHADHLDILAPLFQCCKIRERIVSVLTKLQGGALSHWVRKLLQVEKRLPPILIEGHLIALDRRLKLVLASIVVCVQDHGLRQVLVVE